MHPTLTCLILKTVSEVFTLLTEQSETTREITPSNLFSGFSTLLWKSSNRGTYLVLVLLQQWLESLVGRLFILHCSLAYLHPFLPWLEAFPGGTIRFQLLVCTMWLQQYFVSPLTWLWCWLPVRWPWLDWHVAHL